METRELEPSPPPPPAAGDPISGSRLSAGDPSVAASSNDPSTDPLLDSAEAIVLQESARPVPVSTSVAEGTRGFSGDSFIPDDLRDKIVRQVEYYFSDENLTTDKFLLKQLKRDKKGYGKVSNSVRSLSRCRYCAFELPLVLLLPGVPNLLGVPITLISSFRKMKKLTKDLFLIEAALRASTFLVVSPDGKKVKRKHPLSLTEVKDVPRTVLVENLPDDHSEDNIRKIFESAGHIMEVTIRDPHSAEQLAYLSKADLAISSKLHALVEFDTVEAAENAVLALIDENNWRGMRVQLLSKRMEKYGLVQKGRKDVSLEKNHGAEALEIPETHQGKLIEKEDEEHINNFKAERSRYKSRGKGYHRQPANGQGHWHVSSGCTVEGLNKPIPGPKMPDGTRGFTMGRGKPITI